ncbi:hypothetical protein ASG43_03370 [Aureimonas sp. Leaf454]|uniref:hypothetical protein n=1 Tax=Aureimonas sp. Leaf454 TaxID=1736381 RepID=UPI0006F3D36D|nr:hypothetical protein [Aureimonas sp. Leaf454]KQT54640.1 hypothetical protein ASG43_03370 [Aureimonas sp. Leaf454]
MRHRAREHVNAALDRRSALNAAIAAEVDELPIWKRESFDRDAAPVVVMPSLSASDRAALEIACLTQPGRVLCIADLGLTARQIEKRDLDEFPGERLTFEQKRARREAMRYGR